MAGGGDHGETEAELELWQWRNPRRKRNNGYLESDGDAARLQMSTAARRGCFSLRWLTSSGCGARLRRLEQLEEEDEGGDGKQ